MARLVGLVGATCALMLPATLAPLLVSGNTRTGARGLPLLFLLHLPISKVVPIVRAGVTSKLGKGEGAAGDAVMNAQKKAKRA